MQDPQSSDLPFICKANRLLSVEDLEYVLASHYNETKYDPLGHGSDEDKLKFRPISLNRTQNSHVLQIRNDVPEEVSAIMWICFGIPSFTPYVPFFTNAEDTDDSYSQTPLEYDINSAYWMYRTLSMLTESHYSKFIQECRDYLTQAREQQHRLVEETIQDAGNYSGAELTAFLTKRNHEMVADMKARTMSQIGTFITEGLTLSKLTFNMDINL